MAWQLAVGSDLSLPQVKGPRPLQIRVINAYVSRAQIAAQHDPAVAEQFLRIASLQDPATRMFRPATALRVLLGTRRRRPGAEGGRGSIETWREGGTRHDHDRSDIFRDRATRRPG
jgi:hypothetical protein